MFRWLRICQNLHLQWLSQEQKWRKLILMNWADQADCLLKLQLIGVCKNLEILQKIEISKQFQLFFRYSDFYTLTSQTKVQKLILKTTILSTVIFLPRIFFLKYKLRQIIAVFFFPTWNCLLEKHGQNSGTYNWKNGKFDISRSITSVPFTSTDIGIVFF